MTWVPDAQARARGFSTGSLLVYPGRFVVVPMSERLGKLLSLPELIEYEWPAVVIEQELPTLAAGVLVDTGGRLGLVAVGSSWTGRRLAEILNEAGFAVIEVKRWGWEAPHTASEAELGEYVDRVPPCFLAGS
jgi:hypothetical protein